MFSSRHLIVAMSILGLVACGGVDEQSSEMDPQTAVGKGDSLANPYVYIDKTMAGQTVEAAMGNVVVVKLAGNPTTGYQWKCTTYSKGLPPNEEYFVADQPMKDGSGGTFFFEFVPSIFSLGGDHHLTFSYFRSWEGEASAIETFTVTVHVPQANAGQTIVVESSQNGESIKAKKGDTIQIKLDGNPTTGYEWKCPSYSKSFPLANEEYIPSEPQMVGSGGTYVFTFIPDSFAKGKTFKLHFAYFRSWEGAAAAIETFDITVQIAK
jgi:inhibitor of cysteine peptidase